MKVVKKTNLVPVKSRHDGRVFGVPVAKVAAMLAADEVALVAIPSSVETYEVPTPSGTALPAGPVATKVAERAPVAIPEDWEQLHHLRIVALAKEITGRQNLSAPDGVKVSDYARTIVAEEVARRGGASANAEQQSAQTPPAGEKNGDGQSAAHDGDGQPAADGAETKPAAEAPAA